MSKPALTAALEDYSTGNLTSQITEALNNKSPSPKSQKTRKTRKRQASGELSAEKVSQKLLKADQLTPQSKSSTISSQLQQTTADPELFLSDLLQIHSPLRVTSRPSSPVQKSQPPVTTTHHNPPEVNQPSTITTPNKLSSNFTMDGKRPKMLRQTGKELANIKCVSAKVVFDSIVLENCTQHPPLTMGPLQ
jgi:hypothetical protein